MANLIGGGGLVWNVVAAADYALAYQNQQQVLAGIRAQQEALDQNDVNGYHPAEWATAVRTSITVPGDAAQRRGDSQASIGKDINVDPTTGTPLLKVNTGEHFGTPDQTFIFDAILRGEHETLVRATEHPIQNGASISDHAFVEPSRLTLEIGMSDAMDSIQPNVWNANPSKSISAFAKLKELAEARQPLTVTTKFFVYSNMLIEGILVPDDYRTYASLRATVRFRQIFQGTVVTTPVSARPQDTDTTNIGTKPSIPLSSSTITQHEPVISSTEPTVPNPGILSSLPSPEAIPDGS